MSIVKDSMIEGMQDQVVEVIYSSLPIEEKARNELIFFSKNDKEFTNMKAKNAFAHHETFWLKSINLDLYNQDGKAFNWNLSDMEGLHKFINEGVLEFSIGSKNYINKMPLRNLIRLPEVAASDNAINLSGGIESKLFQLPQAIKLEGGMDFHVNVIGHAGAYSTKPNGFTAETRLQVNLYGMLGRPVQ